MKNILPIWCGLALLLACACESKSATEAQPSGAVGVKYSEIKAGGLASRAPRTLCQLVRAPRVHGGGLYMVESITGFTEKDLHNPESNKKGFTYVSLSLVDPWFQAEKRVTARIFGGPFPSGDVGGWDVDLKVGQQVGLLFTKPTPENHGHPYLSSHGTFLLREDGGYSNGELFTKRRVDAKELGELARAMATSDDACARDEAPDFQETADVHVDDDRDTARGPEVFGTVEIDGGSPDQKDRATSP
jgi:hypothetical protein